MTLEQDYLDDENDRAMELFEERLLKSIAWITAIGLVSVVGLIVYFT